MTATRYPSERDTWLLVVLWLGVAMLAGGAVVGLLAPGPTWSKVLFGVFSLAMLAMILWVTEGTAYELGTTELRVRSGPFSWRVPLAAIRTVEPSHNPLSSPALSLDRLHVHYDGSRFGILVSPQRREEFLADLAARTGLVPDGTRLVRR